MNVLGLHFSHDASVALVKDGKLVSNISSERITRVKKDNKISKECIDYVLSHANLTYSDIDVLAISSYFIQNSFKGLEIFDEDGNDLEFIYQYLDRRQVKFKGKFFGKDIDIFSLPHHIGHSASAYYTSNFDEAVCFSMDSSSYSYKPGNTVIALGKGNKLEYVDTSGNMVSQMYSCFTAQLRLGVPFFKAGSLMGLAAYGKPNKTVVDNIEKHVKESYSDGNMFDHYTELFKVLANTEDVIAAEKINDFRSYKKNETDLYNTRLGMEIAATAQYLFEKSILDTVKNKISTYGSKNLCLSGGSFLNCNVNSLIRDTNLFDNIHHCPASGDDGIAAGFALYVAHHIFDEPRSTYSHAEIAYSGKEYSLTKEVDYKKIAKLISDGNIVAWFTGGSEFGPRALGNRSLLADPRKAHNKEILNFTVKKREWFRPFAPSVLEEESHRWFYPNKPSPYMLYTYEVLQPEKIPAVTHVDNSSRIQTVSEDLNKHYYELIKAFFEITGVPMLLNTSLNGGGESLVESEEDALNLFNNNKNIDILVLNGNIYSKLAI